MKAIRFAATGGPDVLRLADVDLPPPGPGEIRVRHTAIGINFIDTYHRSGLYPVKLPSGLGMEAAGHVEAAGEGVTASGRATASPMRAARSGPMPRPPTSPPPAPSPCRTRSPTTSPPRSSSRGMTAEFLLRRTHPLRSGETILFTPPPAGRARSPASGRRRWRDRHRHGRRRAGRRSPAPMAATM